MQMTDNVQELAIKFYRTTGFLLCETQRMERFLKNLLVLLRYDGSSDIIECLTKNKAELDNKNLGILLKYFKEKAEFSLQGGCPLKYFLDSRNKFAHHLIEIPGFTTQTNEGLEVGLSFLKEYRKSMLLVESILVPISIMSSICWLNVLYDDETNDPLKSQIMFLRERLDAVNKLLIEEYDCPVRDQHELSAPDGTQYFHDYLRMVAIIEAVNNKCLDRLNLNQRVLELWGEQEIIVALNGIAASCIDDQGWSQLAICGKLLKENFPHIQLIDYGVEKLSVLIEISKLFEVKKESSTIYFRPVISPKKLH